MNNDDRKVPPSRLISIRLKILSITVPIILLCILAVFGIFEYNAQSKAVMALQQKMNRLLDVQTKVLSEPMWNLAEKQVQLILEALIEADPDILEVIVFDESESQIAAANNGAQTTGANFTYERTINYNISGRSRGIGLLKIITSQKSLASERYSRLLFAGVLATLLVVAVILGTLYAVNRVVGIPMSLLLDSINQTSGKQRDLIGFSSRDEMGVVIQSYNGMLTREQENKEALNTLNEELEGRVALRTNELSAARDEADRANQAKSTFLATMSHEIRTPLNGIIGMSTLLEGTKLNDEQLEFSQTIRNASDTLLSIINNILDFSKVEAGAIDLEKRPFNLVETIEDAIELVSPNASEKKLELICNIDETVPEGMLGDSTRLQQILMNLMNNAIKFTESGEVMLAVQLQGSDTLQFRVTDTGIGIPADRMDKLFVSFSQVDASTTRRYGGTGLGLVITKKLVELMDGKIKVESTLNKGTIFSFVIPLVTAQAPVASISSEQLAPVKGRKALVVDDNPTNRLILSKKLRKWGVEVVEAAGPFEALDMVSQLDERNQTKPFDFYIVDFAMPKMDGIELAAEIKKHQPDRSEIILYTSISPSDFDIRQRLDTAKLSAVLLKPAKTSQILATIARTLSIETPVGNQTASSLDAHQTTKNLRILLVDDNAINRKVGSRILKRIGYGPDIANSGMEAIEACQKQTYDLVLMDIEMPDMNGISATQKIRELLPPDQTPFFIALTANAMESDRKTYLASGMDGYLSKPINMSALMEALSDVSEYRSKMENS